MITPENTWNPWKPVIKKKKSANNLLPYSLRSKFAPSTTKCALATMASEASLVKTSRCLFLFKPCCKSLLALSSGVSL